MQLLICTAFSIILIVLLIILYFIVKIGLIFWRHCVLYRFRSGVKWCGGENTWAVITGAANGIGLAYAKAMAQKGYSLFLISLDLEKLNKVKFEIENDYKNCKEVKILAVDFRKFDIYDKIEAELKTLGQIHVLINNVGMSYAYPEYFTLVEDSNHFITEIINVNINAMTRLINIVLPQMVSKKSGIIINISSISACFPVPLLALYSATKSYVDFLSRALNAEYSHKGIVIQSVLPSYVSTNFIWNPNPSFFIPNAEEYVKSAINTVGFESRTHGYLQHSLIGFFGNCLNSMIGYDLDIKIAFRRMKNFRDKYFAKRNKLRLQDHKDYEV